MVSRWLQKAFLKCRWLFSSCIRNKVSLPIWFENSEIQQLVCKEEVGFKGKKLQKAKVQIATLYWVSTQFQGLYSFCIKPFQDRYYLYPFSWWEDQSLILAHKWSLDLNLALPESEYILSLKFQMVCGNRVPAPSVRGICYFERWQVNTHWAFPPNWNLCNPR